MANLQELSSNIAPMHHLWARPNTQTVSAVTTNQSLSWFGNGITHINVVAQCSANLVLRWLTVSVSNQAIQANSACPSLCGYVQWVMHGYSHWQGRKDKFCVTVGPIIRTVGKLTQNGMSSYTKEWSLCRILLYQKWKESAECSC